MHIDIYHMQETRFHVGMSGSQCYLLAYLPDGTRLMAFHLKLTSKATTNVLEGAAADDAETMVADSPAHSMLNYFYYIFEKFAGRTALGTVISPTDVHLMLPQDADAVYKDGLEEYTAQLKDGLKDATNKDFRGVVLDFSVHFGWGAPELAGSGSKGLGEWAAFAICLVPIQLCRVEGGVLQPFKDGVRMVVDPQLAVDSMDSIASSISFGLYDSIRLKAACAGGQQHGGSEHWQELPAQSPGRHTLWRVWPALH